MDQNAEHDLVHAGADDEFILEAELARRWRRSVRTLQRWRKRGTAPNHHVIGGRVLYSRAVIEAAEAASLRRRGERQ